MSDSATWRPSHRRSPLTGEVQKTFTEGKGDDLRDVPVVMPEVYGPPNDAPAPVGITGNERAEILRWLFAELGDGSLSSRLVKLAAWSKCLRYDKRPLRDIAFELGVSVGNFHSAVKRAAATLNNRPEAKRQKN